MRLSRWTAIGLSWFALAGGCTGEILLDESNNAGRPPGATPGTSVPLQCESGGPAPSRMRRLTRIEYANTIRDLLGVTVDVDQFGPDQAVGGFASNSISPPTRLDIDQYIRIAELVAAQIDVRSLLGCDNGVSETDCGRAFVERFGRRAFRRVLEPEEREGLIAIFEAKRTQSGLESAARLVVEAVIQAPSFLYRAEGGTVEATEITYLTPFELATRLAFTLWASTPDDALLEAAETGGLATPGGIEREVRRLLADPRAKDAIRSFYVQWLGLKGLPYLEKDSVLYPELTPSLRAAMLEETTRFVEHHFFEGDRRFETLLRAPYSFLNRELGALYGVEVTNEDLTRTELPSGERAGILTQAGFLAAHANADQASPILRGLFVRTRLLCQHIPEPPSDLVITPPVLDPSLTTRERFELHRSEPACSGCHELMDPIGFGFGHYDAIGRYRSVDGPSAPDARGSLVHTDVDGSFDGALELMDRLIESREVKACMTRQWLRFALGRPETAGEACIVEDATRRFEASGGDLLELLVSVVSHDAFRTVRVGE